MKLGFSKNKDGGKINLCARNDRLTCSSSAHNEIQVYSLTGEFLQAHGRPGSGEAGRLDSLRICYVDTAGSVLIADCGNDRLQVMSEQGEFAVLDLQPEVSRPLSAMIFSGHLYVTLYSKCTVHKYACPSSNQTVQHFQH